jgi:hypothetical protein
VQTFLAGTRPDGMAEAILKSGDEVPTEGVDER